MAYHIHLEQFDGPLDLLLSLIEKEKLDITHVSLAIVADQYLAYLKTEESISLDNLAAFLSVAARLILIKSRALLPILEFSDEEEESMEDLEIRLKEYKRFREAAGKLGTALARPLGAYIRESFLGTPLLFYPPSGLSVSELRTHFLGVLGEIPVFEVLPEKEIRAIVTLEEKILHLKNTLAQRAEASFADLTRLATDRVDVIISFLAVLEMVKQRIIFVEQDQFWSDIRIKRFVV